MSKLQDEVEVSGGLKQLSLGEFVHAMRLSIHTYPKSWAEIYACLKDCDLMVVGSNDE